MNSSLPPLKKADLPQRKLPFWRMTGPGAVLVGLSIGAGELVIWPWITAKFGATMAWAAMLGVFLQVWINIEIGRWAIATGEGSYTGFARVWRGFVYVFLLINFLGICLPGWARTSGIALKALLFGPAGPGPDWVWTAVTFAAIGVVLFGPKIIYVAVEKTMLILVIVITLGLTYVAVEVATWENVRAMAHGLFSFGHIELDHEFPFRNFFSAVALAGVGGVGNLFYAYYLRDKQIGMGARIPRLINPMRRMREERPVWTGFVFPDDEANRKRFLDWFRYVVLDQTLYYWLLNSFTMILFMFSALAVLHPNGIVPAEGRLIWDEARILGDTMGGFGQNLFLIVGMAALFSTQLALVDGGSRTLSELINANFTFARRFSQSRWYVGLVLFVTGFGTFSTWLLDRFHITELGFFFNMALISGFSMAIYVPLLLYMNFRFLPKCARPRLLNVIMMAVCCVVYVGFALYVLWIDVLS